uniref:G_PROTEIN_RECEP_F1_2 domain-containing protein n=1 Tax=Bursaphelenchus xylophilus TaxID=6326 RepID=A0A1I7SDM9_BURXY
MFSPPSISHITLLISGFIVGEIGILVLCDMNSSIQTSALECLKAQEISENTPIFVSMIGEILMSCLVLLQLYRCVMLVREKHIQLHANLRLLMTCALIGCIYTCLTSFAFPFFYLWRRSRHGQPCDYMYEKLYCYSLRWPVYYGIVFQSFLHLAISLERALATKYMHTYAQGFLWCGRVIAVGAVSQSVCIYKGRKSLCTTNRKDLENVVVLSVCLENNEHSVASKITSRQIAFRFSDEIGARQTKESDDRDRLVAIGFLHFGLSSQRRQRKDAQNEDNCEAAPN